MPFHEEEIHEVVELAHCAFYRVQRLGVGGRVLENEASGHWERPQVVLQFDGIPINPVGVGEARAIVGAYLSQLNTEVIPDVILIDGQDPNELGAAAVLHWANPNMPGSEVHKNGRAYVAVDVWLERVG